MTSPSFLVHDDVRVAAILHLAQLTSDYPALDSSPAAMATAAIVPSVEYKQATSAFYDVVEALSEAVEYDTRGAEAIGEWWGDQSSADAKATEMAAERRADARLNTELLVSNSDALAVR